MNFLTTRQRDLLRKLLTTDEPIGAESLATEIGLTPRQVSYGLKGLRQWLDERQIKLDVTPGVGIELRRTRDQAQLLLAELASLTQMLLVLTAEERQQLITLVLLTSEHSIFVTDLEELAQISRSTISKDLDLINDWATQQGIELIRRQNFGVEFAGGERALQRSIAMLLWGETPFGKPVTRFTHKHGLTFNLQQEANYSLLVEYCDSKLRKWDLTTIFSHIAFAEAQLGGRFTDDAVLHLALMLALQSERVANGRHIDLDQPNIQWLQSLPVWDISELIASRLGWSLTDESKNFDIAGIAMQILAAPRNERWPGDLDVDAQFAGLMSEIMENVGVFYNAPEMKDDRTLHDGLINHIVPACIRQKLNIWMPSLPSDMTLSEKFESEYRAAATIQAIVAARTGYHLPSPEVHNIASLLRAARIRVSPYRFERVIIVCPSGMATAQLLVARLEARFPRLGPISVVSLRKLDEAAIQAGELIITTVPLELSPEVQADVIQVHPLLLPEDVEKITKYLS